MRPLKDGSDERGGEDEECGGGLLEDREIGKFRCRGKANGAGRCIRQACAPPGSSATPAPPLQGDGVASREIRKQRES